MKVLLIIWLFLDWAGSPALSLSDRVATGSGLAAGADRFWRATALTLEHRARVERQELRTQFGHWIAHLPEPGAEEVEGVYGVLPEVRVDVRHGAIFPVPRREPTAISWRASAWSAWRLLRAERELGAMARPSTSRDGNAASIAGVEQQWMEITDEAAALASRIRYLDTWIPELRRVGAAEGRAIDGHAEGSPTRVFRHSFLPASLASVSGPVILPMATDVSDRKFRAEVEGALETHWNQSPWARQHRVRFVLKWRDIPLNRAFLARRISLAEHLRHFPTGMAVMTTGGAITFVRERSLVLGPGVVNARVLAHELGHLLGFGDCYRRTLAPRGLLGFDVLEWENEFFPDELMCDSNVGVARALEW